LEHFVQRLGREEIPEENGAGAPGFSSVSHFGSHFLLLG
jgi:hypothetical protein